MEGSNDEDEGHFENRRRPRQTTSRLAQLRGQMLSEMTEQRLELTTVVEGQ